MKRTIMLSSISAILAACGGGGGGGAPSPTPPTASSACYETDAQGCIPECTVSATCDPYLGPQPVAAISAPVAPGQVALLYNGEVSVTLIGPTEPSTEDDGSGPYTLPTDQTMVDVVWPDGSVQTTSTFWLAPAGG